MNGRWLALLVLIAAAAAASPGRYLEQDEFLRSAFGEREPHKATLWVTQDLRDAAEQLLDRPFPLLRVHYWRTGERTAWVVEVIGKEEPITFGVAVEAGAVAQLRVLEFRESRGWEIRYPFFTDQFNGVRLVNGPRLNRDVDGITGATLSVRAAERAARLALLLHERAPAGVP